MAALAVALAAAPASAPAQGPGVDEYTLRGPDAKGPGHIGPDEPVSRPEDLPAEIRKQLADDPNGKTLTRLATARELGAPDPAAPGTDGGEDSSAPAAAVNALTSLPGLAVIAALLAIGALALYFRRQSTAGPRP